MIKKLLTPLIPKMTFALILLVGASLILLVGASLQPPAKAELSAYTPCHKIIAIALKYPWERDHCESCIYLGRQIKLWMTRAKNDWQAANMAANYLKLYELNECHEYYRNTSIGPFHLALDLKASEERD